MATLDWEFLGQDGFFDPMDELAQQRQLVNTQLAVQRFANMNNFVFEDEVESAPALGTSYRDVGDEFYGGSTFSYVPTELQIISAVAVMNRNIPSEGPTYYEDPGMTNLVNGLYQNASDFWKEIARANQTGW